MQKVSLQYHLHLSSVILSASALVYLRIAAGILNAAQRLWFSIAEGKAGGFTKEPDNNTALRPQASVYFLLVRRIVYLQISLLSFAPLYAATYGGGPTQIVLTPANDATYGAQTSALLNAIANKYQLSTLSDVARGNSSAQALAAMGSGTSYAMGDYTFLVGGGGALAVNAVNQTLGDVIGKLGDLSSDGMPRFGVGAQLSAVVGMNLKNLRTPRYLGPFEMSRLTILANFMSTSANNLASGLSLSATVAGLHAQYQMRRAQGTRIQYGEILLTTGFDYSRLAAAYDSTSGSKALTTTTVGSSTAADPQLTWAPTGTLAIASGSGTVPIEASTYLRLFYVLSIYAGGAVDFNVGKATTDIHLTGTVTGNAGAGTSTVGSGSLDVSISASPQFASARGFLGLQLNLVPAANGSMLGLFVQGNATTLNGFSIASGLRAAF